MKVYENKVLDRKSGPKEGETEEWGKIMLPGQRFSKCGAQAIEVWEPQD